MAYLKELLTNWRAEAAACIGLAAGTITNYINNLFTPQLLHQFGWSRSEISLIGLTVLIAAVCLPIGGRLADALGVRRVAAVGVVSGPLIFLGLSSMRGGFAEFFLLNLLQVVLVTCTVSVTIYTRLISGRFDRARGLALGIASCTPALVSAICAPYLSDYIDSHGWRAGYRLVALCTAGAGALALFLIPGEDRAGGGPQASRLQTVPRNYTEILRNPAFAPIMAGMGLCNLTITLQTSQLKVIFLDLGLRPATGAMLISLYALSVITGRVLCGVALDRFPAHAVAVVAMGLPSFGLAILGSGSSATSLSAIAVLLLGLSLGAEGDVAAYLVMRYFRAEVYSTVLGLLTGAMSISGALGAVLLSLTLKLAGGFAPFLLGSAVLTFVGGAVFGLLRRMPIEAARHSDRLAIP